GRHTVSIAAIDQSGNADLTPATRTFTVVPPAGYHVNFQPAYSPKVAGYSVDSGEPLGLRSGGLTYGWTSSALFGSSSVPVAYDRDVIADQLKDTFIDMSGPSEHDTS